MTIKLKGRRREPALIWAHKIQYKRNNKNIDTEHNLTDQN